MAFSLDVSTNAKGGSTITVNGKLTSGEDVAQLITALVSNCEAVFDQSITLGEEDDGDDVSGD